MKLTLFPEVESDRFEKICVAAGPVEVLNTSTPQEAIKEIVDSDAFYGKITPEMLAAAKQLRWIQSPTASLEHYIFPELIGHACTLTNMRGLYSDVIADHVFGLITCFTRNLHIYIRQQLKSRWQPFGGGPIDQPFTTGPALVSPTDLQHSRLADHILGVVGMGQIGQEIAKRGVSCSMRVIGLDPIVRDGPSGVEQIFALDDLPTLLSESDFVVIAAPLTPRTEKMFCREQFRQMKNTARLINIGRGAIVDLTDLVEALSTGEIGGAGLDVCEIEPLPEDHPLWLMENVIITPHVAACTPRIAERHLAALLENISRFAAGEPLLNVVDKANWF